MKDRSHVFLSFIYVREHTIEAGKHFMTWICIPEIYKRKKDDAICMKKYQRQV